jgi:hypothetical protein
MKRSRKPYPDEFKQEAVRLLVEQRLPRSQVARVHHTAAPAPAIDEHRPMVAFPNRWSAERTSFLTPPFQHIHPSCALIIISLSGRSTTDVLPWSLPLTVPIVVCQGLKQKPG